MMGTQALTCSRNRGNLNTALHAALERRRAKTRERVRRFRARQRAGQSLAGERILAARIAEVAANRAARQAGGGGGGGGEAVAARRDQAHLAAVTRGVSCRACPAVFDPAAALDPRDVGSAYCPRCRPHADPDARARRLLEEAAEQMDGLFSGPLGWLR